MERVMLEKDPDFYRKVVGMMQSSKNLLKIQIQGNEMIFSLNGKLIGKMGTAEFYRMSVKEIWSYLGVNHEHQKYLEV